MGYREFLARWQRNDKAALLSYKDAAIYLFSRMLFVDGMNGVLFFFGVFAAGVMKWKSLDLLVTDVILRAARA